MLGEQVGEVTGSVTSERVLPSDGPPRVEVSIAGTGTLFGVATNDRATYVSVMQPDGSLYAVTGDATGHGISAGMMVAMVKSTLKALEVQSPHILLTQVNRVIRSVNPAHMNMALDAESRPLRELPADGSGATRPSR